MTQTSYSTAPAIGRKGQLADSGFTDKLGYVSEGNMTFGLLVARGTSGDQVKPVPALPSADVDSIATATAALASAATAQVWSLTDFDGVYGDGEIVPAQRVSLTLNSHADWDATTAWVDGRAPGGAWISSPIAIPDGGNTTVYSQHAFSQVERIRVPAQSGTNGTATVGTEPTYTALDLQAYPGVLLYDPAIESYAAATEVADGKQVSVLRNGRVVVYSESATVVGGQVYVRMVESGTDLRGQFRGAPAANFFPLIGAHWCTAVSAAGLAVVQLGGV